MERDIKTKCIHLAQDEETRGEQYYGAVSFPIFQTATFTHFGVGKSTGYDYSRTQNPTRERVEKVVAQLEGGIDGFALSSGMAAITLLMELFSPGDHLIVDKDLYGGSIRLFTHVSSKNGVEFTSLNCSVEDIEAAVRPNTKAIFIETPTNPMMNVTDIAKAAAIARRHGLYLFVDNTFLSPYFQNPLQLGADVVIHSGTKFLGGHNDTLAGFLVTDKEELAERLRFLMKTTGAGLAPNDCWLILRGIKTLALRMERAQENALQIARWLQKQPCVKRVIYPGLPEHPGHEIMKKQARGFGSMLSFEVQTTAQAHAILDNVKLIQFAESLGGVETLITYPVTQTHADVPEEVRLKNGLTDQVLRMSIGIEAVEDLIEDLDRVFALLGENEKGNV